MATAWTSEDLAALKAAVLQAAQGKTVSFGDRSFTSQDLPELRALLAFAEQAVSGGRTFRLAAVSKGV